VAVVVRILVRADMLDGVPQRGDRKA